VSFELGAIGVAEAEFGLLETGVTDEAAVTDALLDPLLPIPSQMNATELKTTSAKHNPSNVVDGLNEFMSGKALASEGSVQSVVL